MVHLKNIFITIGMVTNFFLVGLASCSNKGDDKKSQKPETEISASTSVTENVIFQDVQGKTFSLHELKGKVVFINFWATWCPPCRRSIPYVKESYEKFKNNNVEFIGISLDKQDGLDGWKEYIKENQMNWVQVADGKFWDNDVAVRYGIESIPSMWVINRDGIIIGKNIAHDELDATITKAIQQ